MLWACGAASARGKFSMAEEIIDSIKYQQVMEANITLSVKRLKMKIGWLLQWSNDPKTCMKIHSGLPQEVEAGGFDVAPTLT